MREQWKVYLELEACLRNVEGKRGEVSKTGKRDARDLKARGRLMWRERERETAAKRLAADAADEVEF